MGRLEKTAKATTTARGAVSAASSMREKGRAKPVSTAAGTRQAAGIQWDRRLKARRPRSRALLARTVLARVPRQGQEQQQLRDVRWQKRDAAHASWYHRHLRSLVQHHLNLLLLPSRDGCNAICDVATSKISPILSGADNRGSRRAVSGEEAR